MEQLSEQTCEACRVGAPLVTQKELTDCLPSLPEWVLQDSDSVQKIGRFFSFKNYRQALEFTNAVAELAEQEDHHPRLSLEWGKVEVVWWTHKINGLHKNDLIMAAKTDLLYSK